MPYPPSAPPAASRRTATTTSPRRAATSGWRSSATAGATTASVASATYSASATAASGSSTWPASGSVATATAPAAANTRARRYAAPRARDAAEAAVTGGVTLPVIGSRALALEARLRRGLDERGGHRAAPGKLQQHDRREHERPAGELHDREPLAQHGERERDGHRRLERREDRGLGRPHPPQP